MKTQLIRIISGLAFCASLHQAAAQGTAFTYQGLVTANGTNFTGSGLFEFALVTSTNNNHTAVATANTFAGYITSYSVTYGGNGYVTPPIVTISGRDGSGATATANLTGGVVTSITPGPGGSGYNLTPTVTIAPPPEDITSTTYWSNDGTSANGSEPSASVSVMVTNGLFTVVLGDTTLPNMEAISAALFNQPGLQLKIWFNDGTHGFAALNPVQNLTPAPYAIYAESAGLPAVLNDPGTQNFFAGQNAGNSAVTGAFNVGFGNLVLQSITSGSYNEANGAAALYANTTGYFNSANGESALEDNTSGYFNTANGGEALELNLNGHDNTADGYLALGNNTTGSYNTADGSGALGGTSTGTGGGNTGSGANALFNYTSGYNNTAAGYESLYADTTGFDNVGIGVATFLANATGYQNTVIGTYAFQSMTSGNGNIGLGYSAGKDLTSGNNNIYIGNLGSSTESGIVRIGTPGSQTNTYLAGNVAFDGGLDIDQSGTYGQNNGTVAASALTFGTGPLGSGEGIASQRTSGPDQFDLSLFTGFHPRLTVLASGNVGIGTTNPGALLEVNGSAVIDHNLSTANITITGGSDLAEPFSISTTDKPVSEGEVVVIDDANPGQLKLTDQPYDTHVAGVVSGANGIHPGIQMHQQGVLEGGKNVALSGRVYVQADTSNGAIKPGDLLTTSSTPGHAMKVTDHVRAQGAILGKAMTGLLEGKGMVLVLVTLQ